MTLLVLLVQAQQKFRDRKRKELGEVADLVDKKQLEKEQILDEQVYLVDSVCAGGINHHHHHHL